MFWKKSVVSILSFAALTSCAPSNTPGANNTSSIPMTPTPPTVDISQSVGTKSIAIHKSYSVGEEGMITLNGSMVVENDTIKAITIDNPQGPQKIFAKNISEKIVGKSTKGLQVDTISGASLTSVAFNEFLKTVN